MRVLVVHGRYRSAAPSGENNVVDRESAALAAAGHEVELFERASDDIAGWPLTRKAALPARALWNGEVRRDLARRLQAWRPDVVHVHNTFPLLSPSVLHACRDAGVPVVVTVHNYKLLCASGDFFREGRPCHDCAAGSGLPGVRHGCYRGSRAATLPVVASTALHRAAWRELVAAYVFISAAHRDLMADLDLPADRVFVKHNFVPEPAASPDRRVGEREHLVAYLGRLDAAKGVPFLMRAWDRFRALHPSSPLRLVVAGGGPLADDVGRWAAAHSSVEAPGLLPPAEAARLLGRARAVVVPSQWEETFGLVAVEAMAAGTPPVAPARGSFPELVGDGVDGVLFEPEDPDALARVLADVDARPDHFADLGRRARTTYESGFREADNLARLLEVYRFAVEHPLGAPVPARSAAAS
jgi:glycosyltransferase involved in cell wall biosynthesis